LINIQLPLLIKATYFADIEVFSTTAAAQRVELIEGDTNVVLFV